MASAEADMHCKSGIMETTAQQQMIYSKLSVAAQIQAKEADVQALVEFTRALDKKVAKLIVFHFFIYMIMKEEYIMKTRWLSLSP